MRLYTEEQVHKIINELVEDATPLLVGEILSEHDPIELPSDEEIEKYAKSINPYPSTKQGSVDWENGFIRAIQWYREQIKKK